MRNWLVDIRRSKGLSQKAVCEAIGITQPTYWEYEHEDCKPSPQTAQKIGKFLGFDWTRFYTEQEESK